MTLPFHPYADLFPLIEGAEFEALVADVRANGVLEAIRILDGQILDGRNRYRAGIAAGRIDPDAGWHDGIGCVEGFVLFRPEDYGDPLKWVLSKNLHRRHLSESQRAMIADELATLQPGRPAEWRQPHEVSRETKPANLRDSTTQADAAELLHVSERSVQTARTVRQSGAPELVEAVKRGDVKVSAAAEVATLPVTEQLEILRSADPRAFSRVARERREALDRPGAHRAVMASRTEPDDSLDYFPTPPWATRALLDVLASSFDVDLTGVPVWEPACGEGHMSGVLMETGADVMATDVFDYSSDGRSPPGWARVGDFLALAPRAVEQAPDWIISNPPFTEDKAELFILNALDLAEVGVAMFVRVGLTEGVGRYESLFSRMPPTLVAFFAERVPLVKGRWDPQASTASQYIWLVWVRDCDPKPPIWIAPGRRAALSRADDVARFTAHPVLAPAPATLDDVRTAMAAIDADLEEQEKIELQGGLSEEPTIRNFRMVHSGASDGPVNGGGDDALTSGAGASAAPADVDLNAIIRAGYARNAAIAELEALTGLSATSIRNRALRMGISSRDRQRAAVAAANRRRSRETAE